MKFRTCLAAPAFDLVAVFDHYIPHRWHRLCVGRIDELALYDHPVSAVEVRRHYVPENPGGSPSRP